MESGPLDRLDREILHALTLAPRAQFSRLGTVLGVSDQTVSRRYRRMAALLGLRVTALLDGSVLGYVDWFVRVRCSPGDAIAVSSALTHHDQTSWVRVTSGGTEIVASLRAQSAGETESLLLGRLAASGKVTAISAHCLLHRYRGGPDQWPVVTRALSPAQARALLPPRPPPGPAPPRVEPSDSALLDSLYRDGRASYTALAAATGWSEARVRRRLERLQAARVIYFDIDLNPSAFGMHTTAEIWMSVEPSKLVRAGEELARSDEVAFAAATTGPTNLLVSVVCRDTAALYEFITTRIGALDGVQQIETAPIERTLKRAGPHQLRPA